MSATKTASAISMAPPIPTMPDTSTTSVAPTPQATPATPTAYRLTLMTSSGLSTLRLPAVEQGELFFVRGGKSYVRAYAKDGVWRIAGVEAQLFTSAGHPIRDSEICDSDRWVLKSGGRSWTLFSEAVTPENFGYARYFVSPNTQVSIGRGDNCGIRFENQYISNLHATLECNGKGFWIKDANSKNGVYVNGERVTNRKLELGDVVSMLSLRIVIGAGFIAVNSGKQGVRVHAQGLEAYAPLAAAGLGYGSASAAVAADGGGAIGASAVGNGAGQQGTASLFSRRPRRRMPLTQDEIELEMPPYSMNANGIPLVLRMGGSAVHGAASVLSGNPLTLISTLLFPLLTSRYTEKQRAEYERRRIAAYTHYLRIKAMQITDAKRHEELVLRGNYPKLDAVLNYPSDGKHLWERRVRDDDFLSTRVGAGDMPLAAEIRYPKERFDLEIDALEESMYELAGRNVLLKDVPIMVDFREYNICGVTGPHRLLLEFARQILMRLAVLYSYDELKLVVIANESDMQSLKFARYLPHVWNDAETMRYMASSQGEAYLIGETLARELESDLQKPRDLSVITRERPYYFVISLSKQLQDNMEVLKACAALDKNCGLTLMSLFGDIPKDCSVQITLTNSGRHSVANLRDIEEPDRGFALDAVNGDLAEESMRQVANTRLKNIEAQGQLPKSLPFLEMYGVGRISHLNILKRWEESDPTKSLAVPVGADTAGENFMLDLHQKYQGPHGLVAGMTGSGKSEFLLTYILSLAINFRPEEVSFLLIDYKGGGLAGAFEDERRGVRLPHLAGTITNLDGAAIQRSLISLQGEVLRRQRMFNEAKTASGESTMDIYAYQRLYRQGVVAKPVSHLFIISDEFAELKAQKPEFLDSLVSIARIGRSLGVHLILATQKPAGIVNDQIQSNVKFRVCLKVQTKYDSMDMLKRPDAAELQDIGRFYLQVGYNELFALGQSAWSGAPYTPSDRVAAKTDRSIEVVDGVGQRVLTAKPPEIKQPSQGSQLSCIVAAIAKLAAGVGSAAEQLWPAALPKTIELEGFDGATGEGFAAALRNPYSCAVGMMDDPENQDQHPLVIDFASANNMLVVGQARSGKTTLVQSILLQLAKRNSPSDFNFYVLDYSSRLLPVFAALDHCGAAMADPTDEELQAFFGLIDELIAERKELFSQVGLDNFEAARGALKLPLALVVIDNFPGMRATKKGDALAYRIEEYLKSGPQYGIKYLITCSHPNEVNTRAKQEIGLRIALQAKDKYEYGDILGCRVSYIPPDVPGRGLCAEAGRPLEVQVACVGAERDAGGRIDAFKDAVAALAAEATGKVVAKRLPSVDDDISYEDFCAFFGGDDGLLPLGYHLKDAKSIALPLRQMTGLPIYFGSEQSELPVLSNLAYAAQALGMHMYAMKRASASNVNALAAQGFALEAYETTKEDAEKLVPAIVQEMQARQELWEKRRDEASEQGQECLDALDPLEFMRGATEPWLLLIESMEELCAAGDDVTKLFAALLPKFREFNMYAIGCFYPSDSYGLAQKGPVKALGEGGMALLFGGRYSQQRCTELPSEYSRIDAEGQFNKFLMRYRGSLYAMQMPCELSHEEEQNPSDKSIFE